MVFYVRLKKLYSSNCLELNPKNDPFFILSILGDGIFSVGLAITLVGLAYYLK